jgi:hypothetical protein
MSSGILFCCVGAVSVAGRAGEAAGRWGRSCRAPGGGRVEVGIAVIVFRHDNFIDSMCKGNYEMSKRANNSVDADVVVKGLASLRSFAFAQVFVSMVMVSLSFL